MQVGRYQILETLGSGATSRVVRGHDPLIDRAVAIKLFSPELARGETRNVFFREARVVGKLVHPCIVTLHDMGIEESTLTPYLVMELVEGQSLEKLLTKGSIPAATACAWVGQLALALDVAHRRSVIHGDVKPANVLITEEGRPKLTDFGMARLARRDGTDTRLLGTPAYWSPEQILGRAQDARSDIFSLGVMLYEMLTGVSPFAGASINAVCNNILSTTPRPVAHLNTSIASSLSELVATCLEKDPAQRLASTQTLADQLFPHARQKPVVAHQPAVPSSLRHRAARLLRSA